MGIADTDYQKIKHKIEDIFKEGSLKDFKELEAEVGKKDLHEFKIDHKPLIVAIFGYIGLTCSSEKEEFIYHLIENGADINAGNSDKYSVLHAATHSNCFNLIEKLLKMGVKTDIRSNFMKAPPLFYVNSLKMYNFYKEHNLFDKSLWDKNGKAFIHKIITDRHHSPDLLKVALEDFGVNNETILGETPLMLSMKQLYYDDSIIKNIKYFLDNGADVNVKDLEGNTALILCMKNPEIDEKLINLLLSYKPDMSIENDYGLSPLFSSAVRSVELVKKLSGENIDLLKKESTFYEETLIVTAVKYKNLNVVKYLIDIGLDVNKADITGYKPLNYALDRDNQEVIVLLKKNGAKAATSEEMTSANPGYKVVLAKIDKIKSKERMPRPLKDIVDFNKENIKKFVQQNGINDNSQFTRTYLLTVLQKGTVETLKYIESLGVDFTKVKDEKGYSLVSDAVEINKIDFVKYLVEQSKLPAHQTGKSGNILRFSLKSPKELYEYLKSKGSKFQDDYEPLDDTIYYKNLGLVKVLLEEGFKLKPDVVDYDESLERNISDLKSTIIQLLLENGLDKNKTIVVEEKTYTLKEYAKLVSNETLVKKLEELGAK